MSNIHEVKEKAKATWATGTYQDVAVHLAPMSAELVRAAGVRKGERVLDVACGTGVTAITARRAGAEVTGFDLTPELLAVAKMQGAAAGADEIVWKQGDAEDLPFRDGEFDVVLSSFGHMFTPQPDVVAKEMARVAKPGGRIAFVTHTPEGVIAGVFAAAGRAVPAPANAPPSPMLWGQPETVKARLGSGVTDVRFERGRLAFPMLSPEHFWHLFSTTYGPTMRTIAALGDDRAKIDAFRRDFVQAVAPFWRANGITLDYLVTTAVKR